jgi:hypothetical protein
MTPFAVKPDENLGRVLRDHALQTLAGCLAVADEIHTRVRRPTS